MTALVTQPEAHLLALARAAVGAVPASEMTRLLVTSVPAPPKLGPTARRLLTATLARGSVLALARSGGWRNEQGGRLWERHRAPPLEFGPNLIGLFRWVLQTNLTDVDAAPLVLPGPLTPAEELVAALLLARAKGTSCELVLARQAAFRASPLVVLVHAADIARASLGKAGAPVQVPPIRAAEHAVLIDGLRDLLARTWLDAEASKRDVERPEVATRVGVVQEEVLRQFFAVIAASPTLRGLASFVIDAATAWLSAPRSAADYVASLSPDAPMRERTEARKASGALLRALATLRQWDQEHRSIRFIDDDYQTAQHLVRAWEPLGDRGFREAERVLAELEALPT